MPKCNVLACSTPPREATLIGRGPHSTFYCCRECSEKFVKGPPSFTPIEQTEKGLDDLW